MVPVPNRMAQAFRFRTRRLDGEFSFDVIGMIESLFEVAQNGARMMSVSGVVDSVLQRITLTYGRGARISIEDSLLPRASTVHNNK
jgi:hypothetical protein